MVLLREGAGWQIAGSVIPEPRNGVSFDPAVLALVLARPDVWRCPALPGPGEHQAACAERPSVVAAPVLDDGQRVIAAVYGVRHGHGDDRRRGIRSSEARVVELIADAVGAGMARREKEIESVRQQMRLEQVFSPSVVEHLRRRPEALTGRTREATLLVAELRSFARLAEGLPSAKLFELLGAVMEQLTDAVIDHGGVIVDYSGEGLSALWNAPLAAPEHADLACQAAMCMLEAMPTLSDRWRPRMGRPLELGIGLHVGEVHVGNLGTRRRIKYGPRGAAVQVAGRVQAATRQLGVPLLATDAVRRRLSARFVKLKACSARMPGLEQTVELFTILPATDGERLQADLEQYSEALMAFERGDLDNAERMLEELLTRGPATPAAFLARQAAALRRGALGRRVTDLVPGPGEMVIDVPAS
jgi:adenylate cyclase